MDRLERTTLEIDIRLLALWRELQDMDFPLDADDVGRIMHAAYGFGYVDCLREENPGELCRAFGWRMPERKTAPDL